MLGLLPCVHCGESDLSLDGNEYVDLQIACDNCSARGPVATIGCRDPDEDGPLDLIAEAAELWNQRQPPPNFTCRRCSECEGSEHHWLQPEHCQVTDTSYVPCKHCDARAALCDECMDAPVWPVPENPSEAVCALCAQGSVTS